MSIDDSKRSAPGGVTDELLEHEYDGIREYDNPMPKWWVWMFWGSFWFALFYFFHFHVGAKGTSVAQAYVDELKEAREAEAKMAMGDAVSEEGLAKLMANKPMMGDTQAVFKARCEQCHADKGQGLIGPNLTDDSWIHGKGTLMDIYKTVDEGVPAKGMPAWGRQLTPIELRKVVAYVGSLRGTNVPGKPPEGEKVDMAASVAGGAATDAPSASPVAPTDSAAPAAPTDAAPSAAPSAN